MIEKMKENLQRVSKSAIAIFPLAGLVSAIAANYFFYSSDDGMTISDIFFFWSSLAPVLVVLGIIIWCINEFFPKMVKTITVSFLIGTGLSVWLGALILAIDF